MPDQFDPRALDPLSQFRLDGKVVLVTGASSGLGMRFARVLHAVGAQVAISARRADRLEALAAELPGVLAVPGDVGIAKDREHLVATVEKYFGRIDVLVNNAGISRTGGIEVETLETFEDVLQVNTVAVWHLCKLAGVGMVERKSGCVVNIASMLGLVGATPIKQANYSASKGAVINMTRELALQWARKGIRVNSLCPGWFESEMTAGMESDEGSQRYITTNSPMPRMGFAHELDGALLFLASDASSFMTGQNVVVDGGWTAR